MHLCIYACIYLFIYFVYNLVSDSCVLHSVHGLMTQSIISISLHTLVVLVTQSTLSQAPSIAKTNGCCSPSLLTAHSALTHTCRNCILFLSDLQSLPIGPPPIFVYVHAILCSSSSCFILFLYTSMMLEPNSAH